MQRAELKWHYIFFFGSEKATKHEFGKMHYHSILSTRKTNPEFSIIYHTNIYPSGEFWELVKDIVEVRLVEPPTEAFGNPLLHPAHQSDWYRLNLLIEEGGIYTDFDTIQLKSFSALFMNEKLIIGKIGKKLLNNGVMIAPILNSPYLLAWRDEWKNFRSTGKDKYWLELSCEVHEKLLKNYRSEIECLEKFYFYPFIFQARLFLYCREMYRKTLKSYSVHLYDSQYSIHIDETEESDILKQETTYTKLLYSLLYTDNFSSKKIKQLF
jgi:hypothetical protein